MKNPRPDLKTSECLFSGSVEISDPVETCTLSEISTKMRISQKKKATFDSFSTNIKVRNPNFAIFREFRTFQGILQLSTTNPDISGHFWAFSGHGGSEITTGRILAGEWPEIKNLSSIFCALQSTESELSNARRINFISHFATILKHFMYSNPNFQNSGSGTTSRNIQK